MAIEFNGRDVYLKINHMGITQKDVSESL